MNSLLWQNISLSKLQKKDLDLFCQNRRQIFVNEVNRVIKLMHEIANLLHVVKEFTSLRRNANNFKEICHIIFVKRVDPLHLQVIASSSYRSIIF